MTNTNQCILIGEISSITKVKGKDIKFHLDIPDEKKINSPIITVPELLAQSIGFLKTGIRVMVTAKITTEVRGGYGTVTQILAQKITELE